MSKVQTAHQDVHDLILGICVNGALTVGKFLIGSSTHCAALLASGYQDLSGAARSGMKLAFRCMRKDLHERGKERTFAVRLETIVSVAVFILIVYLGVRSLESSIRDVLDQHDTRYTPALYIISALSVAVKAYMAHHERILGRKLQVQQLLKRSDRSAVDAIGSAMILCAAIVDHTCRVDIDPWVGLAITVLILTSGLRGVLLRKKPSTQAPPTKND